MATATFRSVVMRGYGLRSAVLTVSFLAGLVVAPRFACVTRVAQAADYETLMREGIAFRRSGDDVAALKRFEAAYATSKTTKALVQIGLAEQALGRWTVADKHLHQALESADDPWVRKNRASLDEALSVIASHVGQLEVSGTPAGAEVRIDGELVGKLPLPRLTSVAAGGVAVEVRAPGFLPIIRAATITARTLTRETFTLQVLVPTGNPASVSVAPQPRNPARLAAASDPGTSAASESEGYSDEGNASDSSTASTTASNSTAGSTGGRTALILTASGLSVASLAFAVFEHLSWQRKVDTFASMNACGTTFPNLGAGGCKQLHDDGQRARLFAFVGYGLGAAFGVTALLVYLTSSARGPEPGKVACVPASITIGLACSLRF